MTDESNVRAFPGTELPLQTLIVEREPFNYCRHDQITLDVHSRSVRCVKCEKVFDPFDFLQTEVARIQDAWRRHDDVRRDLAVRLESVDSLKKEEARLKARIKTAKAKADPVIDIRNRGL